LIRNWQSDDGLPHDTVSSIVQTHDGFLWVATDRGLARFDGLKFTVFSGFNRPDLGYLSQVSRLFEAGDGSLLIVGSRAELAVFRQNKFELISAPSKDLKRGQFRNFLNSRFGGTILTEEGGLLWRWANGKLTALCTNDAIKKLAANGLGEDDLGQIWLIQRGGNLLRFAAGKLEVVNLPAALPGETCLALTQDAVGRLWLGTSAGLAVLRAGQFERVTLPDIRQPFAIQDLLFTRDGGLWVQHGRVFQKLKDDHWISGPVEVTELRSTTFLAEDRWGRLCVGTQAEGLFRIAEVGTTSHTDHNSGLPGDALLCHLEDREGNEWFGLKDAGLVRLRPKWIANLHPFSKRPVDVSSVCEDHEGGLWISIMGEGVFKSVGSNFVNYAADVPPTAVGSLLEDSRTNLWLGTSAGLFQLRAGRFVQALDSTQNIKGILNLYADSLGRLWFGCGSGLYVLEKGQLTHFHPLGEELGFDMNAADVRAVIEDRQGRIWVGTGGRGLLAWEDGKWKRYLPKDGLGGAFIMALYVDTEGNLWVSTYGGGLSRWRGGQFFNYNTGNGLADNFVTHISEDRNGWLWMGSSKNGVFRVAKQQFDAVARGETPSVTCIAYDRSDGLVSMDCNWAYQSAGCTTRDGRLLLPTLKGVVAIHPETVELNPLPPPVFIEALTIEGRPVAMTATKESSCNVPPGTHLLEITFNALCYSAPEKVRFRHTLTGLESTWIESGNSRSVQYYHLGPGKYQFQVTACNNDGVWNRDGATLAITIQPFFWETWTFRALCVLLLLGTLAGIVWQIGRARAQRKINQLQRQQAVEQERGRIARDMHDELGSRLTKAGLITKSLARGLNQQDQSRQRLASLQQTVEEMTLTMDELVWTVNPKQDTLNGLANYLVHYTKEFLADSGLECRLDLPTDLPSGLLSSQTRHGLFLAFKEALNNCVHHAQAHRVAVIMRVAGGVLRLEVSDDGQGFAPDQVRPVARGLENMRERLASLGGTCLVESVAGQGTRVTFEIPCGLDHPSPLFR